MNARCVNGCRLVFIGGMHRSGTTPLARALASHPDVSGLTGTGVPEDEGQHLQTLYPRVRELGGMSRFALDPRAHLTEESPLVSERGAETLMEAWTPFWDLNRQWLLEKSPSNLVAGRFLQALFPGSALVVMVRHPIVTALAMQKWNPLVVARNGRRRATFSTMVANWCRAHELLRGDLAHLDRVVVLRYEDLTRDAAGGLGEVQRILGLGSAVPSDTIRAGHNDAYAEQWEAFSSGPPHRRHVYKKVLARFSQEAATWGYDLADPRALHPWSVDSVTER